MPVDMNNKIIYVDHDNDKGITLVDLMRGLGYYKRDKNGNRDLGMIIKNAPINKWAKRKPFRSPETSFDSEEERDFARKAADGGLVIPTAANAGVGTASQEYQRRYLGQLAYLAVQGIAPNYTYARPRGVTENYNEPFRILDFDGYSHNAPQPFTTSLMNRPMTNERVEINRFTDGSLTCVLQRLANADMLLSDLLYGNAPTDYYFTAEVYKSASYAPFFSYAPDEVHRADEPISAITDSNYSQSIVVPLDSAVDGKAFDVVIGINRFLTDPEKKIPDDARAGFIAPWTDTQRPFLYHFTQQYYAVFDFIQQQGYYIASSSGATYTAFDVKDYNYTYKTSYGSNMGLSLKFKRQGEDYRIVGANANVNALPTSGFKVWIRAVVQSEGGEKTYPAVVVGSSITGNVTTNGTNYQTINDAGEEYQMVYLRFDNILPSIGSRIGFIRLDFSTDGTNFTPLGNATAGHDTSSVYMYLQRA